jgi:plastocyanin
MHGVAPMKGILIIGLLLMAILISSCSEQGVREQIAAHSQSDNLNTKNIIISNYSFQPNTITISKGTTIVWTNDDSVAHTIDSDVGHVDSDDISPGASYSVFFDYPGIYRYHGGIYPSMKGTIIVR